MGTYQQDVVGALSTFLSVTAGIVNLITYLVTGSASLNGGIWIATFITELVWSGIIEIGAITAVFIVDSDVLRAVGGVSMVGVNATGIILALLGAFVYSSPTTFY